MPITYNEDGVTYNDPRYTYNGALCLLYLFEDYHQFIDTDFTDFVTYHQHLDCELQVTVTQKLSAGDNSDSVSQAVEMDLALAKRIFGIYNSEEHLRAFVVPHNQLSNVTAIAPTDVINDGTVNWRVRNVDRVMGNNQWVCLCVKER